MKFKKLTLPIILLQCAACASSIDVPLILDPGTKHVLAEARLNGRTGMFLIDTGTSMPVVSERFLADNNIEIPKRPFVPRRKPAADLPDFARLEHQDLKIAQAQSFSVGKARFDSGVPFLVLNLASLNSAMDAPIDGIIGGGLLNGAYYQIDFPEKRLTLTKRRPEIGSAHQVEFRNQLPYVTVSVDGHDLPFMIDTGALQTTIESHSAKRVIPSSRIGPSKTYKLLTVNGLVDHQARRAMVSTLQLANETFASVPVFLGPINVIGLDILSQGTLTVDPHHGLFMFERHSEAQ